MTPMGQYKDFEDCKRQNSDKEDPDAYCGAIKHQVEGKSIGGFLQSAIKGFVDFLTWRGDTPNTKEDNPQPTTEYVAKGITLTKDAATGRMRWTGIVSGNFKDRDREVFPSDVHQEFIDHLDKGGRMPELWLWHTPGSRFGQADFADFDNGFVIMSGLVDAGKEAIAEKVASLPDQGMSHGFRFKYREPRVIGFYRTHEVSVLPREHASFPWAKIEIQAKECAMKPEKQAYLEQVLGKDAAAKLIADAVTLQKSLQAQGVDWKDFDPNPPAPAPTADELFKAFRETDEFKALAAIPGKLEAMGKAQADAVGGLQATVKALQDQNAALVAENTAIKEQMGKSQDELVAAAIAKARGATGAPASKSNDNKVTPGEAAEKAKPSMPLTQSLVQGLGIKAGGQ